MKWYPGFDIEQHEEWERKLAIERIEIEKNMAISAAKRAKEEKERLDQPAWPAVMLIILAVVGLFMWAVLTHPYNPKAPLRNDWDYIGGGESQFDYAR